MGVTVEELPKGDGNNQEEHERRRRAGAAEQEEGEESRGKELPALLKGFDTLALAATFTASIQASVMNTTVGTPKSEETMALRAINALFLCGLVIDLMAAFLAFLTSRWLQRLTDSEKVILEQAFEEKDRIASMQRGLIVDMEQTLAREKTMQAVAVATVAEPHSFMATRVYSFLATCLFTPMPMLALGLFCMVSGLLTFAWTQHSTIVAAFLSAACFGTAIFVTGVMLIGREGGRRVYIIRRLSHLRGDW